VIGTIHGVRGPVASLLQANHSTLLGFMICLQETVPKLSEFLHLVDNRNLAFPGEPRYDPYTKILSMLDDVSKVFQNNYMLW
jgi:hypothetical protein